MAGELMMADVRAQLALSLMIDFEAYSKFRPNERHEQTLGSVPDQVVAWSNVLAHLRVPATV